MDQKSVKMNNRPRGFDNSDPFSVCAQAEPAQYMSPVLELLGTSSKFFCHAVPFFCRNVGTQQSPLSPRISIWPDIFVDNYSTTAPAKLRNWISETFHWNCSARRRKQRLLYAYVIARREVYTKIIRKSNEYAYTINVSTLHYSGVAMCWLQV